MDIYVPIITAAISLIVGGAIAILTNVLAARVSDKQWKRNLSAHFDERNYLERKESYIQYLVTLDNFLSGVKADRTLSEKNPRIAFNGRFDEQHPGEASDLVKANSVLRISASNEAVRKVEEQCTDKVWDIAKRVRQRPFVKDTEWAQLQIDLGVLRKKLRAEMLSDLSRLQDPT